MPQLPDTPQNKIFLKQAIIVEGKYDKMKLSAFIGSTIIATNGFAIFRDSQQRAFLKTLAAKNGLIILTDSDTAGFKIRNYLKSLTMDRNIIHIYIPPILGKEKRKDKPSKENLLGVEGISLSLLQELFVKNGVFLENRPEPTHPVTKQQLYEDGLSGGANSAIKRRLFLKELDLPPYISANALPELINQLMDFDAYQAILRKLPTDPDLE